VYSHTPNVSLNLNIASGDVPLSTTNPESEEGVPVKSLLSLKNCSGVPSTSAFASSTFPQ
jgi:hypothetical protein